MQSIAADMTCGEGERGDEGEKNGMVATVACN